MILLRQIQRRGVGNQGAAAHLPAGALLPQGEGRCSYLSLALLAGVGLHELFGWWWADPVGALAMLPVILLQGWEPSARPASRVTSAPLFSYLLPPRSATTRPTPTAPPPSVISPSREGSTPP
jgi:hypothetical protein